MDLPITSTPVGSIVSESHESPNKAALVLDPALHSPARLEFVAPTPSQFLKCAEEIDVVFDAHVLGRIFDATQSLEPLPVTLLEDIRTAHSSTSDSESGVNFCHQLLLCAGEGKIYTESRITLPRRNGTEDLFTMYAGMDDLHRPSKVSKLGFEWCESSVVMPAQGRMAWREFRNLLPILPNASVDRDDEIRVMSHKEAHAGSFWLDPGVVRIDTFERLKTSKRIDGSVPLSLRDGFREICAGVGEHSGAVGNRALALHRLIEQEARKELKLPEPNDCKLKLAQLKAVGDDFICSFQKDKISLLIVDNIILAFDVPTTGTMALAQFEELMAYRRSERPGMLTRRQCSPYSLDISSVTLEDLGKVIGIVGGDVPFSAVEQCFALSKTRGELKLDPFFDHVNGKRGISMNCVTEYCFEAGEQYHRKNARLAFPFGERSLSLYFENFQGLENFKDEHATVDCIISSICDEEGKNEFLGWDLAAQLAGALGAKIPEALTGLETDNSGFSVYAISNRVNLTLKRS